MRKELYRIKAARLCRLFLLRFQTGGAFEHGRCASRQIIPRVRARSQDAHRPALAR